MKKPRRNDADPAPHGRPPPQWVAVTWASEQLRDRIQRNETSLAEVLQAGNKQAPPADPGLADREAEPG